MKCRPGQKLEKQVNIFSSIECDYEDWGQFVGERPCKRDQRARRVFGNPTDYARPATSRLVVAPSPLRETTAHRQRIAECRDHERSYRKS